MEESNQAPTSAAEEQNLSNTLVDQQTEPIEAAPLGDIPAPEGDQTIPADLNKVPDYDNMSLEEIRADARRIEAAMRGEQPEPPLDATSASDEPSEAAPAEQPTVFAFTEDADTATYLAERERLVALMEDVSPEVQQMLERDAALLAQFAEQQANPSPYAGDVLAERVVSALDQLVEFVQDEETGAFVPNSKPLITVLEEDYATELPYVIQEINSQPSPKYQGYTRLQEYVRDGFGLDSAAMKELDTFLQNGGQFAVPNFVPEGIHPSLLEAFWTAEDRSAIEDDLERLQWTLVKDPDATQIEKDGAKAKLDALNRRLAQVQTGLDARKKVIAENRQVQQQTAMANQNAAVDRFIGTTRGIIEVISQESAKGLQMMDGSGAAITGAAFGTLIETAFSDNDGYAKYAQDQLAKQGITADWNKAFEIRDRLFEAELKIVNLEKTPGINPRAIQNAHRDKDLIVKELIGLAKEAGGKINAKVVGGAGKKLEKQIGEAVRIPAPRLRGGNMTTPDLPRVDFDKMSLEEVRAWKRDNDPYRRATQGDMAAFE